MSLRNRLAFNLKWHRRIGLLCAFFVFILCITGILLNHTSSLKLDSIKLRSSILSTLYNLPNVEPVAFETGDQWLSHNGIDTLFLGERKIDDCAAPLKGAAAQNGLLIALCDRELLLFTGDGELLERITSVLGLPDDSSALGLPNQQLLIQTASGAVKADLDSLEFTPVDQQVSWINPQQPPAELSAFLSAQQPAIDLEQVLLDLHSGRLFGWIGVLVMDLVAVLLMVLAITGFIVWQTGIKMRTKR